MKKNPSVDITVNLLFNTNFIITYQNFDLYVFCIKKIYQLAK